MHECPLLACPLGLGTMRATRSPFISARNEQPTPHYPQVVTALCSGWPSSTTDFSISVAVGHACTHAPHETHSDAENALFCPGEITDENPRPSIVSAKVPCTSSHARTHREHTMHFDGSKVKYGFE